MSTAGMNKTKLAMADLDGTLVFTRAANHLAYARAMEEHGFSLTPEDYDERCDGRAYRDFLPQFVGDDRALIESIHDRKIALYGECLTAARLNTALADILRALKPTYILALVTTASRANVENVLRRFGLESLFDLVVTQEDVTAAKPDPSCYNAVIEHFGIAREDCIIFEDSPSGIAAALASGCQTLCVRGGDV